MSVVENAPLHDTARERYLSYALSVITSRALPDVRDGLKPVQRRILYTMFHELSLHPGGRYRKCAAVVGDVMGKYHPHGDSSIYEALVRMAQDFSLRATLIDPQGNFGSLDGDPPAAMRYTECRLRPIAEELLQEITRGTVDFRPTYDGQREEPVVLPAQFPQLLVNGCEGIAVGLSTRIPPHHLGEVAAACVALIDGSAHTVRDLLAHIHGPDFPTGGRLLNDIDSLCEIYETGQGTLRIRGTWTTEQEGRKHRVVLTSIPYGVNKAKLIERIGQDVGARKLPLVVDVRDESTEDVRVVLDLRSAGDAEPVMAWLFKHTPFENTFPVHMNALVPVPEKPEICVPERLDLKRTLELWLDFRNATVRRRFEFDLQKLEERIHILEGFALLFGSLDEAIRLIRESEGKRDAANKLIAAFHLSELQADAILELRLYKIARLEIQAILDELTEKRAAAAEIRMILGSEAKLWSIVRDELVELARLYDNPRRTEVGVAAKAVVYDEQDFVVREDTVVVATRDGWIKRQGSVTSIEKIRVREGDEAGWIVASNTAHHVTFLTSDGLAFTTRIADIQATTGYGKPLSTSFSVGDGARLTGMFVHDPQAQPPGVDHEASPPEDPPPPYLVAITRKGRILRLPFALFSEPSNKNGRIYARLDEGDEVLTATLAGGDAHVSLATEQAHALVFALSEAPLLRAAGKGTTAIKLHDDDQVIAADVVFDKHAGVSVTTSRGRSLIVSLHEFGLGHRAARGKPVLTRGTFVSWDHPPSVIGLALSSESPTTPSETPAGDES